jgi:hypothetical protein
MDGLFTVNNPGYWVGNGGWTEEAFDRAPPRWQSDDPLVWEGLLTTVHWIGQKMWGNRWRRPPFALGDTASLNRFMFTIAAVRTQCASGVLRTRYETLTGTTLSGPDGEEVEDFDVSYGGPSYDDWYPPNEWERFFLLGAVRFGRCERGLYVLRYDIGRYLDDLQPQQDEPAPVIKPTGGGGRPPEYDWEDCRAFVEQQLNERGDPTEPDQANGWRREADVVRAALTYIAEHNGGKGPDFKHAQKKIGPMIEAWRRKTA